MAQVPAESVRAGDRPDTDAPPLESLLRNRRWLRRTDPYPYILARDVFTSDFYRTLEATFNHALSKGLVEGSSYDHFARSHPSYDAYLLGLAPDLEGPLSIFLSRAWHDLVAGLFEVRATGDVQAALHHHAAGGKDGTIHNDLNPGWFADHPRPDGANPTNHTLCNYFSGKVHAAGAMPRETVRAVAMLFYLCNPGWEPGDGGETGLYRYQDDDLSQPVDVVPPLNNSLLAFECTPYSFHSFLSNWRKPRNCVVMWAHRTKEEVVRRWGEDKIIPW